MIVSTDNASHYNWGNSCDGWHFAKSEKLSVIRESMPPGSSETMHYHEKSEQFFYIFSGNATMIIDNKENFIFAGQGIHILPFTSHQLINSGAESLEFIVISTPPSHGDRVLTDK